MAFGTHLEGITLQANTPNEFTPIVKYKVPAGATVIFPVTTRIIMKLYETGGAELDNKDEMYFAFKLPAEKTWTPLTEVFTYQKFKQMTISEQTDYTRTPTIRMSTAAINAIRARGGADSNAIAFPQDREIALFLKSSKTFDTTNVENYLELPDVEVLG